MSPPARRLPPFLFISRTPRTYTTSFVARGGFKNAEKTQQIVTDEASHCHIVLLFAGLAFRCQKQKRNRWRRRFPLDKMRRVASRSYLNHLVFRRKHSCRLKFSSKLTLLFEPNYTKWTAHMTNAWFHIQQQTSPSLFWRFASHVKSLKSNVLHLAVNWMWRHTNFLFQINLVPREDPGNEVTFSSEHCLPVPRSHKRGEGA